MGQYFYFFNATTGKENNKPLDLDDPHVTWVSKLNYMCRDDILGIFRDIAKINNWCLIDDIIASGDGGEEKDVIHYNSLLLLDENPQRDDNVNMCDTDDE